MTFPDERAMQSREESSPSTWRFSVELLSHVHTLQVFLLPSSSQVQPAQDCTNLEATLLSAPPALSCSWRAAHEATAPARSLRLPLPVLLFDYSSSPHISALADCIQLTLHLLPLSPLHLNAFSSLSINGSAPVAVSGAAHGANYAENGTWYDDCTGQSTEHGCTQTIKLPTGVDIHGDVSCEVEGTHETPQAGGAHHEIGRIASPTSNNRAFDRIELNRKDVSEDVCKVCPNVIHPHGNGCNLDQFTLEPSMCFQQTKEESKIHRCPTQCIDGAVEASENPLLCQHANNLHGQCDDFARHNYSVEQGSQDCASQGSATFVCKNCLAKVSRKPVRNFVQLPCFDWREVAENWFGACCCSFGSAAEVLSVSFERSLQLRPGKCLVGPSTFYMDFCDVIVKNESGISSKETNIRQLTTPHFLAFGNGFMVWEDQQSKVIKWLPVRCTSCASLIGAYPCTSTHSGSSKEGLHLFRCQVITCHTDGTFDDTYRLKTFKDLLVKELRLRTDENTTYRFLIRSLSSKLPLLQMVVLNYDALICTGRVNADVKENPQCMSEITGLLNEAGLQQSIKVLFLDCTRFSGDDVRSAEIWVKEHDAETVFMLEEYVDRLRDELLANSMFCPANCGLFQSFMSSFLYTMQD